MMCRKLILHDPGDFSYCPDERNLFSSCPAIKSIPPLVKQSINNDWTRPTDGNLPDLSVSVGWRLPGSRYSMFREALVSASCEGPTSYTVYEYLLRPLNRSVAGN